MHGYLTMIAFLHGLLWHPFRLAAQELMPLPNDSRPVYYMALSPDGRTLASAVDDAQSGIALWDVPSRTLKRTIILHKSGNHCMAFTPDGKHLVAIGSDGPSCVARVWDLAANKCIREFSVSSGRGVITPDGKNLITMGDPHVASIYDLATGKEVGRLAESVGSFWGMAVSADGSKLATGFVKKVIVWDLKTRKRIKQFDFFAARTSAAAFSPDGKSLAAGDPLGRLAIWDWERGRQKGVWNLRDDMGGVASMAYTPDGQRIVLGGSNGRILLWDAAKGAPCPEFRGEGHARGRITCMAMSRDGAALATASVTDKVIIFWKIPPPPKKD